MGVETNHREAFYHLARRYVLGGLSFWDALTEAARLDSCSGIETFKSSAIYQLEGAVETLRAENRELRAELKDLEQKLDPSDAEAEAFEREMESRLAREREVEGERRACA
jgi:predicted RNase H-like nuclease (RuvC/YqgF family)